MNYFIQWTPGVLLYLPCLVQTLAAGVNGPSGPSERCGIKLWSDQKRQSGSNRIMIQFIYCVFRLSGQLQEAEAGDRYPLNSRRRRTGDSIIKLNTLNTILEKCLTISASPGGFVSPPLVIPPAVPEASIRLEGNETEFDILWEFSRTEFGSVLYCVVSEDIQFTGKVKPFFYNILS